MRDGSGFGSTSLAVVLKVEAGQPIPLQDRQTTNLSLFHNGKVKDLVVGGQPGLRG